MKNDVKFFNPSFFILLVVLTVALSNQVFYRYQVVFNVGTNWRVMDLCTLLLLFIVFSFSIFEKREKLSIKEEKTLFFLIGIYWFIGIIAVIRGFFSVGSWAIGVGRYSLLEIFIVPIILLTINSEAKLKILLKLLGFLLIPIWLYIVLSSIGTLNVQMLGLGRARFVDATTCFGLASVTILILPLVLGMFKGFGRYALTVIFSLTLVIFAQSRSVWVATTAGILSISLLEFKFNKNKKLLVYLLSFFIVVASLLFLIDFLSNKAFFSNIVSNRLAFLRGIEQDYTGRWRLIGWLQIINDVMDKSPLFGMGFSEMGWVHRTGENITVWEHNQYVHFFRAAGLIGVFSYMLLLTMVIRYLFKMIKKVKGSFYTAVLIGSGSAIAMNIVFMFFYNQNLFLWLNIGILMAATRLGLKENSDNNLHNIDSWAAEKPL